MIAKDKCIDPYVRSYCRQRFSKVGQIVTKKRTALDDNSLEMLIHISYDKILLNTNDVKGVLDKWKKEKDHKIFANKF